MRRKSALAESILRLALLLGFLSATKAMADAPPRQIPDEYEATGGHTLGLNNAGVAVVSGLSAVRVNPAMLPLERRYRVGAGYNWPTGGREFYQVGVVDSKTSQVAAGASYTGYTDDYVYEKEQEGVVDSPIIRRGVLSLAQTFGNISAGISGHYVEAHPVPTSPDFGEKDRVKGFGLGIGVAGMLTPQIRFGASGDNISNKKIKDYAPPTYRGGVAYFMGKGEIVLGLDYRQRERVTHFEQPLPDLDQPVSANDLLDKPEQMVLGSVTATAWQVLQLVASYGQSLTDERRSLSGGVALVNEAFTISYAVARPYMSQASTQQAIAIGLDMAM